VRRFGPDITSGGTGKLSAPKEPVLTFEKDYDFEQANSKFAETVKEICSELDRLHQQDEQKSGAESVAAFAAAASRTSASEGEQHEKSGQTRTDEGGTVVDTVNESPALDVTAAESGPEITVHDGVDGDPKESRERGEDTLRGGTDSGLEGKQLNRTTSYYDKALSFFDKISCESVEKAEGKFTGLTRQRERALNQETFGVPWARYMPPANQIRGRGLLSLRGVTRRGGMPWAWCGYRGGRGVADPRIFGSHYILPAV
jgi:hypothetical protein